MALAEIERPVDQESQIFSYRNIWYQINSGLIRPYPWLRHERKYGHLSVMGSDYVKTSRTFLPPTLGSFVWNFEESVNGVRSANYRERKSLVFGTGPMKAVEKIWIQPGMHEPIFSIDDMEILPIAMRFGLAGNLREGFVPQRHDHHVNLLLRMLTTGGADFDSKHDSAYWLSDPIKRYKRAIDFLRQHYKIQKQGPKTGRLNRSTVFFEPTDTSIHEMTAFLRLRPDMNGHRYIKFENPGLVPMAKLWMGVVPNNQKMTILALEMGLIKPGSPDFELVTFQVHMTGLPDGSYTDLRFNPYANSFQQTVGIIDYTDQNSFSSYGKVVIDETNVFSDLKFSDTEKEVDFGFADLVRALRQSLQRNVFLIGRSNQEYFEDIIRGRKQIASEAETNYGLEVFNDEQCGQIRQLVQSLINNKGYIQERLATELTADLAVIAMRSVPAYITLLRRTGLYKLLAGWRDLSEDDLVEMNREFILSQPVKNTHTRTIDLAMILEVEQESNFRWPDLITDPVSGSPLPEFMVKKTGMEIVNELLEKKRAEKNLTILADGYAPAYQWWVYNRPIHANTDHSVIKL